MLKNIFLIFILFLGINLAGCWQKKVTLEYKPSEEIIKYKLSMTNKAQAEGKGAAKAEELIKMMNMSIDMDISQKTSSSSEKGVLLNDITLDSGTIKSNAGEKEFPAKGRKITIKIKTNGEVVENSTQFEEMSSNAIFPDKPVGVGDKWPTNDIKLPRITGSYETVKGNYVLEKFETVDGQDCALITLELPEKELNKDKGEIKVITKGNIYFDYNKGLIASSHMEYLVIMKKGNTDNKLNMTMNIDLKKI